jgi:putative transcriptional regulator
MTTRAQPRLATRLRVARAERRLSQGDLARMAGVSRQTVSSIETGQYCPSTILALRISNVLGVRIEELFWLEGEDDV